MPASGSALTGSAAIFAALGDETRLGLVTRLGSGGSQSISSLTTGSKVTRQAVTKHLVVLADAGLVRSEWRGRERCWELEPDRLDVARRYLELISEQWTQRLDALARHLDAMPDSPKSAGKRRRAMARRKR